MKTYTHSNLGKVIIDKQCQYSNKINPDTSSIFVIHDNDIKEVSVGCIKELRRIK